MISRVVLKKVEQVLGRTVSVKEFSQAVNYIEGLGFQVNDRSSEVLIMAVAKRIDFNRAKEAVYAEASSGNK